METKTELKQKAEYYKRKLAEVQKELDRMETCFCIDDKEKPFSKYNIQEMNDLYAINQTAFEYLDANKSESIMDYNLSASKEKQVMLEK